MCTSGIVAKAVTGSDGGIDWPNIWGALIGFGLNATESPERRLDPYNADALRRPVTGFAFDIDSEPPPGAELLVELPTRATERGAAFWGGVGANRSPVHAGHNEFRWSEVNGPPYISKPPPLDTTALTKINFHIASNATHAVSYRFCINNLTALLN